MIFIYASVELYYDNDKILNSLIIDLFLIRFKINIINNYFKMVFNLHFIILFLNVFFKLFLLNENKYASI